MVKIKMKIIDMPKLKSPFVRNENTNWKVIDEITEGYEWVFEDESVMAIEKLDGTNVSIEIVQGIVTRVFNRKERIQFISKDRSYIIEGIINSKQKGYLEFLEDGQHFGELIGPMINKNPYKLDEHLWIPFETYGQKHLAYTCWGKYPKTFESISEWFKELMPLYNLRIHGKVPDGPLGDIFKDQFVEGIVFTHPDGRMAKLRRDMFDWYKNEKRGGKKDENK